MSWIIEHWRLLLVGSAVLGLLVFLSVGMSKAIPSGETVSAWSIQEAIFYGCLCIAFSIFVSR